MRYSNERPDAAIKQIVDHTVGEAAKYFKNAAFKGEWATEGFGITAIRPQHVGAGNSFWGGSHYWSACYAASETWSSWISATQTDLAYEVITGLFNLEASPITSELYLRMSGVDLPTLNVEEMYAYDISRLFFKAPVSISPTKPWDLYMKAVLGIGIERIGLLGYTVAAHPYLILRG